MRCMTSQQKVFRSAAVSQAPFSEPVSAAPGALNDGVAGNDDGAGNQDLQAVTSPAPAALKGSAKGG